MTKKIFVGISEDGPDIGSNYLISDFLGKCIVDFISVDKQILDGIGDISSLDSNDKPDFIQDISSNKLTILLPNFKFQYHTRLMIIYTPICLSKDSCVTIN